MKIAVLGSAGSVAKAPFQNAQFRAWQENKAQAIMRAHDQIDGEFDIWGCSPGCWAVAPRATRWFEVHRWEVNVPWFSPEYVQFLRDFKGIVYTGGTVPEIPNHVVYPIDAMEAEFSSYNMTSSLALMMALAISTIEAIRKCRHATQRQMDAGLPPPAYTEWYGLSKERWIEEMSQSDDNDIIGLWGVDMAASDEYSYQRPGCQNYVIEATRRGIGIYLPPESDLMRPMPVYGISEWKHNYIKLTGRARELNNINAAQTAAIDEARLKQAAVQGELHALNYFVSTWTSEYGMQHGLVNRQAPGTGMGSGITHYDGRPITQMTVAPVLQAMAAPAPASIDEFVLRDAKVGADLCAVLMDEVSIHPETNPQGEGAVECLRRIISERDAAEIALAKKRKKKAPRRR